MFKLSRNLVSLQKPFQRQQKLLLIASEMPTTNFSGRRIVFSPNPLSFIDRASIKPMLKLTKKAITGFYVRKFNSNHSTIKLGGI